LPLVRIIAQVFHHNAAKLAQSDCVRVFSIFLSSISLVAIRATMTAVPITRRDASRL
jgi:hypothetical protein